MFSKNKGDMPELNLGALTSAVQNGVDLSTDYLAKDKEDFSVEDRMDASLTEKTEETVGKETESDRDAFSQRDEDLPASKVDQRISRVELTPDNLRKLDFLRLSKEGTPIPRSKLVNDIISQYLNEHTDELKTNVKAMLDKLLEE